MESNQWVQSLIYLLWRRYVYTDEPVCAAWILLNLPKDDLSCFQISHFHHSSHHTYDNVGHSEPDPKEKLFSIDEEVWDEDEELQAGEDYIEDDDGLGYYPDGVQRTLTDEQIAIFRHSEIYSLVRKRQIQKENCDLDGRSDEHIKEQFVPNDVDNVGKELDAEKSDNDNDDGYLEFLEAESKQMEADRNELDRERRAKKRKFGRLDNNKQYDKAPTHRRIARELDDAILCHDVLDYDEGTSENHLKEHSPDGDYATLKEMKSEPSATVHATSAATIPSQPQGRKIWWPIIEKR